MSLVQTSSTAEAVKLSPPVKYPWWRAAVLGALLLLTLVLYPFLYKTAPPDTIQDNYLYKPFLGLWIVSFLPYFAACALVLATKPAQGHWRWVELSIVLAGAFVLRALLLPLPPGFSRDSWRYLWDARVTLHGFSPYVYRPISYPLRSLVDTVLFPRMRFRASPTIYPPGAQAVFLLSYLLAGSNLYFLKGIFLVFDMVTCGALVVFLKRRGIDACRVLIYAWCPLPIIEFAIQGHVDVISLTFSILALLSFSNNSVRGRILTGFLLGMAALTKIYPILLLVVVVPDMLRDAMERNRAASGENMVMRGNMVVGNVARSNGNMGTDNMATARVAMFTRTLVRSLRAVAGSVRYIKSRDYALVGVCLLTILLGYLPYYIMGHGQVLGYFTIYSNEQGENAGIAQLVMQWVGHANKWSLQTGIAREHVVSLSFIIAVSLVVFVLRLRQRMSMAMAALLLFVAILAISPHVFPWYTTVLLMWVPLLIGPLWTGRRLIGHALAVGAVWYFVSVSILQYYYTSGPHHYVPDWTSYYEIAYWPVAIILAIAVFVGVRDMFRIRSQSL
jgi:hypothetical protein